MSHEEEKDLRPRRNRVTNAVRENAQRTGYITRTPERPEKEISEAPTVRKEILPPIESTPPSTSLNIPPEKLHPQSGIPQASSTNAVQSPRGEKAEPNNPVPKWEPLLAIIRRLVLCIGLLITTLIIIYPNGNSTVTTTNRRRATRRAIGTDYPSYSTSTTYIPHGRQFIGTHGFNPHKGRTIAEALISLSFTLGIVWALRPPKGKKKKQQ